MPAKRGSVPVKALREAVARQVEATSLRQTAKAVGMSFSGLHRFLEMGDPYPQTYRKLIEWYVLRTHLDQLDPEAQAIQASLELLTTHLPVRHRREVQKKIVALIKEEGVTPAWMKSESATKESRRP